MADEPARQMTPDEFRALGRRMVDWIADYWERVGALPVLSQARPGETADNLPNSVSELFARDASEQGVHAGTERVWDSIFRDLDEIIVPGLTHWQSPNFYAYFPANISGPAVLGELLSAGLGVQGMLWQTSPACTELETRVLDWLAELCRLPSAFLSTSATGGGVIQGTASEAALVAMVAARTRALARTKSGEAGSRVDSPSLCVYASTQAHSSIIKAAMIAGIARGPDDREHVRLIGVDADGAMKPEELASAIREDTQAGRLPIFVCATIGTTGTTAIDPVPEIGQALRGVNYQGWLHIDAAHAGAMAVCPEFSPLFRGLEFADSYCFNPHKWLLTNFDCNCFWTSDRAAIVNALSITPEYLRNAASDAGTVIDYRDWQVPLGRRFRALKLWFVLRHFGLAGLQESIREHVRLAALFQQLVAADAQFEIPVPRTMNLVCFRLKGSGPASDELNRELMTRLNRGGKIFLTHTQLPSSAPGRAGGRIALRMAIGSTQTQERHVRAAWGVIVETARELARP